MRQLRAFLAIPLPNSIKNQIRQLQKNLAVQLPGIRWANPETLHLTLRFFGQLPEESLDTIGKIMLFEGSLYSPFQVQIRGVGAFPNIQKPRVIWLGLEECPPLVRLQAALEQQLRENGLPGEDRPFKPHLTLGRSRRRIFSAAETLAPLQDVSCGSLDIDKIILFESRLTPQGAVHLPLKTVELGSGRT